MRNQIVQWIFLPADLTTDGQLAVSIFISPRLRSDEGSKLADFPDFLDWPQQLNAGLTVTLERADGVTEAPMQTMMSGSSTLWQALFPPDTPIRSFEFEDYADRPLVTYPLRKVLDHLQDRWASLASQSLDELPLTNTNASPIGPPIEIQEPRAAILSSHFDALRNISKMGIFEGVKDADDFSQRLVERLGQAAAQAAILRAQHNLVKQPLIEPFAQGDNPSGNLYRLMGFHRRPKRSPASFPSTQDEAAAELREKMEFHHLLSTLGDHPALLRALGLVIDLIVRPDFVPTTLDTDPPTKLRAIIQRPSAFPPKGVPVTSPWNVDVTPWSFTRLTNIKGQAFFSAVERSPASRRFAHGFVHMDPERFAAVSVDVDGLALKAFNMAATLSTQEERDQRPIEEPAEAGVPTPRTGGVAFVQSLAPGLPDGPTSHAENLHDGFYQARNNEADLNKLDPDNPPILAAEDLVRGYRMDIFDGGSGTWRSLHQRFAKYSPLREPEEVRDVEDEGTLQLSLTGEVNRPDSPANPDGALYAHEALITWDGWSLAAKRPERAIPQEPAVPEAATNLGALNLDIALRARPGSLPLLRFGREYKIRVRAVDLAGNAHTLEQANNLSTFLDSTGLPELAVSLPSRPLVYRRFEPVPAPELIPRKRFAPGEGLERLVVRSNFDQSAEDYSAASQGAADETLRFFPFCDRHVAPAKAALQLAELHGMFDDALASVHGLSSEAATAAIQHFYGVASRENGTFHDVPGAIPDAAGGSQAFVDADESPLPYLPDPWCGGAVIRVSFAPGTPEEHVLRFRSEGEWHQLLPVRLRLEEGDPAAQFVDPAHRQFAVRLPRGRTARLRVNSMLVGDPELFGITDWCRTKLSPTEADQVVVAIKASRHWMTTPWRTLELVHAVQKPLEEPGISLEFEHAPDFHRGRDATAADLAGRVFLDIPSTAQLDLVADWDDVVDDPAAGVLDVDNMLRHIHTIAFSVPLPEPFGTPWGPEIGVFLKQGHEKEMEFHTVSPEQETPEHFRLGLLANSTSAGVTVQDRNRLAAAAAHIEKLRPHELGDTKYRTVSYQMVASTRFREYFDPRMPPEEGQRRGNIQTIEMLNSAVPPTPVIIDVVPILTWKEEGTLATGHSSTRRGTGLRVWLRRPWFGSGAGEMLGVVCRNDGIVGTNSTEYREITYMARDPVHDGIVPFPLGTDGLIGAEARLKDIKVQTALGVVNAAVATFKPRYDPNRDAWYCDLQFDTGAAYFPFVRLGLVRYQPRSIPGCETSHIVATSFVQTLPDRTLSVVQQSQQVLSVRMHGPAPQSRRALDDTVVTETNLVVAVIEEQDARVHDIALGWMALGAETVLAAEMQADGLAEWSGDVPLTAGGGGARRLCVREFELHPSDDRSAAGASPSVVARRLVHADVLALDGL